MTLNGVIALILCYFTEFDRLDYVTVVKDRSMIFGAELYSLFRPKLTYAAVARSVCDS